MQRCPYCGNLSAWQLGDGRFKCRNCGRRYSWTSAWDSVRLPEATKRELLERFVRGEPSYRQRSQVAGSAASRERFNRLVRACCTGPGQAEGPAAAQPPSRSGSPVPAGSSNLIAFALTEREGHVEVAGPVPEDRMPTGRAEGVLHLVEDRHAIVVLRARGGRIAVRKEKSPPARDGPGALVERFWSQAREWLRPYRGIPQRYFMLYLGEAAYRFNHRHEELEPLLLHLMQTTSIQELRPLLGGLGL